MHLSHSTLGRLCIFSILTLAFQYLQPQYMHERPRIALAMCICMLTRDRTRPTSTWNPILADSCAKTASRTARGERHCSARAGVAAAAANGDRDKRCERRRRVGPQPASAPHELFTAAAAAAAMPARRRLRARPSQKRLRMHSSCASATEEGARGQSERSGMCRWHRRRGCSRREGRTRGREGRAAACLLR